MQPYMNVPWYTSALRRDPSWFAWSGVVDAWSRYGLTEDDCAGSSTGRLGGDLYSLRSEIVAMFRGSALRP